MIKVTRQIDPEWDRLMTMAQKLGKGKMVVIVNEGKPVQVEVAIKKIKLDGPDEEYKEKLRVISVN
ncbi:MAG: hypothetical protein M3P98_01515 [bacterium]|nr:hypothetical protein [bacterium]